MKVILLTAFAAIQISANAQLQTSERLDVNQISTVIHSNGDLFYDYINATFTVPADSTTNTIYMGAAWIGGLDTSGALHVAAQTYRQSGSDFFQGPVMNSSSYSPVTDAQWDKVWKVNKTSIDSFLINAQNPIPFYSIPSSILNWPGNGNTALGQSPQLAPFVDVDGDGIYNPQSGDYPCIKGDQALFVIFNDDRNIHTESDGRKFGIEVHAMLYAYSAPGTWLDSTVFLNYKLFNRSDTNYTDMYWGQWTDFDLGAYQDDYLGCDVTTGTVYVYNGDSIDGNSAIPTNGAYGINPPSQGLVTLRGPEADAGDGMDNNRNGILDEPGETCGLWYFVAYENYPGVMGNPTQANHYYNYLQGRWKDSSFVTHGGNGYGGTTPYMVMYPGDSDPSGACGNWVPLPPWSEISAQNNPGDRRGVPSTGPFSLPAGSTHCLDYAYVYGRGNNGPLSSIDVMKNAVDSARSFYLNNNPCTCDQNPLSVGGDFKQPSISVFPNPGNETVNIICGLNSAGALVEFIDVTGKTLISTQMLSGNSTIVNTANLESGVYLIRVTTASGASSIRFVRN